MDSILFGVTALAFGWLVVWYCTDRSKPGKTWWPFDYRSSGQENPAPKQPEANGRLPLSRQNPTRPWKRSGF